MRVAAIALGVIGGLLELLATTPGSVTATTDLSVISCWVTFGAGLLAIVGAAVTGFRPGVGAALMVLALIAGALAATGTIPAIQDMLIIPYFLGAILVLTGAVFAALASRKSRSEVAATPI